MKDKVNVVAVEKGFHVTLREPGETFDMPPPVPSWCKSAGEAKAEAPKQPDTPPGDPKPPEGAPPHQPTTTATGKGFTSYHAGAGRYGIKDANGERFGDFTGTKEEAETEAERLNAPDPDLDDQDSDLPDA